MIAMSKPAHFAVLEQYSAKPVICFVPSRRPCRLAVDDLLTLCLADDKPNRFLNIKLDGLQPHLDYISDMGFVETLKQCRVRPRGSRLVGQTHRSAPF